MMNRRITNISVGMLVGRVPGGQVVKARHLMPDRTGYEVLWDNSVWHSSLKADFVRDVFGIDVKSKKTGDQVGSPAETVTRAVWRHLKNRYNEWDPEVQYVP